MPQTQYYCGDHPPPQPGGWNEPPKHEEPKKEDHQEDDKKEDKQ